MMLNQTVKKNLRKIEKQSIVKDHLHFNAPPRIEISYPYPNVFRYTRIAMYPNKWNCGNQLVREWWNLTVWNNTIIWLEYNPNQFSFRFSLNSVCLLYSFVYESFYSSICYENLKRMGWNWLLNIWNSILCNGSIGFIHRIVPLH